MAIRVSDVIKATRSNELIITPRLNLWLMAHGDDELPADVARIIYEQMTTKPRVRSASFSASSAGMCYRRQELAYLGVPTYGTIDPRLQNIFNDGKWRHLRWQAMGMMVPFLFRIEMPIFWRKMRSRGTIDGLGYVPDDHPRSAWRGKEYGFELKGTNPFVYARAVKQDAGTKVAHKRQISRYFLTGGFDLFVTIYENKATQEWFEWVEEPNDKYLAEQEDELDELNDSVEQKELHPMLPSCKIHTGPEWNDCPFAGAQGPCVRAGKWPGLTPKKSLGKKKP